jgi:protein sidekick
MLKYVVLTLISFEFQPLQQTEWYGNPKGYNISYRPSGTHEPLQSTIIDNPTGNAFVLSSLEEFTAYEVIMAALNDVGMSEPSKPSVERTREAGIYKPKSVFNDVKLKYKYS